MEKKTKILLGTVSAFLLGWWAYDRFYLNKREKKSAFIGSGRSNTWSDEDLKQGSKLIAKVDTNVFNIDTSMNRSVKQGELIGIVQRATNDKVILDGKGLYVNINQ